MCSNGIKIYSKLYFETVMEIPIKRLPDLDLKEKKMRCIFYNRKYHIIYSDSLINMKFPIVLMIKTLRIS